MNVLSYNTHRNMNIDAIKGVAIILVVIGHCIQYIYAPQDFDDNIIFRIIYSFHMPLFMFISGYVVFKQGRDINANWLKKRFINLMVPYITWIFLVCILGKLWTIETLGKRVKDVVIDPTNGGMWFLYVLFLENIILYILNELEFLLLIIINKKGTKSNIVKIMESYQIVYLLAAIIFVILYSTGMCIYEYGIGSVCWYMPFYLMGYWFNRYRNKKKGKHPIRVMGVIIFLILVSFWKRVEAPHFVAYISNEVIKIIIYIAYIYLVPLSGIISCSYIVSLLPIFLKRIIAIIGCFTIEIYLFQWYIIGKFCIGNLLFDTLLNIVAIIFISIVVALILRKSKVITVVLFGKKC